jgi:hypothetical protein
MIACASDDSSIIGICGETKLANERQSLTTMIQVSLFHFILAEISKANAVLATRYTNTTSLTTLRKPLRVYSDL